MFKIVEQSPMIDYHEVMEHVEQKYGIRTRDYAGKFSVENLNAQKDHKARWLTENGYMSLISLRVSKTTGLEIAKKLQCELKSTPNIAK